MAEMGIQAPPSPEYAPSPERLARKPLTIQTVPANDYFGKDGFKENISSPVSSPWRPTPEISSPHSSRKHGSPMSPVKMNYQSDDWTPEPFSVQIEGVKPQIRHALSDEPVNDSNLQRQNGSPVDTVIQQVSHRPKYTNHGPDNVHSSQRAVMSYMDSTVSPRSEHSQSNTAFPSRESSVNALNNMQEPEEPEPEVVPAFQYHHHQEGSEDMGGQSGQGINRYSPNMQQNDSPGHNGDAGMYNNRNLTPTIPYGRRSVIPRPGSAYSDFGPRGRTVGNIPQSPSWQGRAPSAHSAGRSPDSRPTSYIDLLNVPYPQPPPVPNATFDNSQLRTAVGSNASLLSTQKTLEMYRLNVKKTNDLSIQYAFAVFLIAASQEVAETEGTTPPSKKAARGPDSPSGEKSLSSSQDLLREARQILSRLSDRSYPFAQYYLADGYASGLFNKGKEDHDRAFPLFIAASKHGHAESGYRAALCYEFGWGSRKDPAKAVQFYRQSASKNHPGAMTRLGRACLSGDLGMSKYREGLKWLKRATESADPQYNAAPYHLGLLYETGYGDDIFLDETYAAQLFTQAADLGHAEASYRLGDAYEHGKLSCPRDPALSVHFYTGAAQQGHPAAMMALCAWYMVGAEPVLEKDENEAYEWARRAADFGLTKAEYAVGYFTEMGIGCRRDPLEANVWYVRAADAGDDRATHRLAAIRAAASGGDPMQVAAAPQGGKGKKSAAAGGEKDKDCIIM